ncbi:hypothetical protein ES332_D08G205800v1 [Gossypium tomentosum]|uniref:Uncharacterized protein n=1 Tax=Gossypium tomentosum TaxID=34277 RepID=A0A5D2JWF9_GOSTO|nr:hypothetical protein ES332_D08G205800v1 [Gossypium tomentosum]
MLKKQVDDGTVMTDANMVDNRSISIINSNSGKKMSSKRIGPGQRGSLRVDECGSKKRKFMEGRVESLNAEDEHDNSTKRQKKGQEKDQEESLTETMSNILV